MDQNKKDYKIKVTITLKQQKLTVSFRILANEPHQMISGSQVQITKVVFNLTVDFK